MDLNMERCMLDSDLLLSTPIRNKTLKGKLDIPWVVWLVVEPLNSRRRKPG